jgi:hypothetical protein
MAFSSEIDILDIVRRRFEVASGVITLGDVDVVIHAAL